MPDLYGCRQASDYGSTKGFLLSCAKEKDGVSFINWLLHIGASAIRQKGDCQGKIVASLPTGHAHYLAAMVGDLELFIYGEWKDGKKYAK